ncbi:MAG: CHAT domain-containing protein [Kofleriaceae bacterium]|nr:CHAT domain-containing protein [Kofleriaceae bacterium]
MTEREHEQTAEQLGAFLDGELAEAEAERVRDHLATCAVCQGELHELMQLVALEAPAPVRVVAAVGGEAAAPGQAPAPITSLAEASARRAERAGRGRSRAWVLAPVGLAAAAGMALWLGRDRGDGGGGGGGGTTPTAIALAPARGIEGRLTWGPAAAHRPYQVDRAGAPAGETVPLKVLAALEERGDQHGLGALAVLAGDGKRAAEYLARAAASPEVDSDRALVALAGGDAEGALRLLEGALALERVPNHRPGEYLMSYLAAARWNRALALRDLGLPRAAAAEFAAVAAAGEPGWADEARRRGDELRAADERAAADSARVVAAGPGFVATGAGLTVADAVAQPGLVRMYVYDAVRAAPDAARVRTLRPLAEALDRALGSRMVAHVDAIAGRNFAVRAPLARTYAALVAGTAPADLPRYLAALRRAGEVDLLLGVLLRLDEGRRVRAADLPEYQRLAASTGEPWFELLAAEQTAERARRAGAPSAIEAALGPAFARCQREPVVYRCARVAATLADHYLDGQRLGDARRVLRAGWALARSSADRFGQDLLLPLWANLVSMSDDPGALPLVRSYADEYRLRSADACRGAAWSHDMVAMALTNHLRLGQALRELAALDPACAATDPDLQGAFLRAHLLRRGGADADVAALRAAVATLRTSASPAERAVLDHIEGRLLVERSPREGQALLSAALAAAERMPPSDVLAAKARAYSTSVLVLEAGRTGDFGRALTLLARERRIPVPARCVVGVAVEDERRLAVVRDAAGVDHGVYAEDRTTPTLVSATLVPAELQRPLAGCTTISVLARPPVQGAPDLLPPELAWGYGAMSEQVVTLSPGHLIVHDIEPPAWLGLPRLAGRTVPPTATSLAGAAATPARVLAAMAGVGLVEIDAHGLVNAGDADASHVVLSPGPDGQYALDVAAVRATRLTSAPLVVLAACHAATAAPTLHQAWSLPDAFVHAGARAVIASTDAIPDAAAGAFFADLTGRLASVAPAVALRDARVAWKSTHPGDSWVDRLLLFQ